MLRQKSGTQGVQSSTDTQTIRHERRNEGDSGSVQISTLDKSMSVRDVVLRIIAKTTTVAVSFMMLKYECAQERFSHLPFPLAFSGGPCLCLTLPRISHPPLWDFLIPPRRISNGYCEVTSDLYPTIRSETFSTACWNRQTCFDTDYISSLSHPTRSPTITRHQE